MEASSVCSWWCASCGAGLLSLTRLAGLDGVDVVADVGVSIAASASGCVAKLVCKDASVVVAVLGVVAVLRVVAVFV